MSRLSQDPVAHAASAAAEASGGRDRMSDPLLQSLLWLCQHHGRPRTPQALLAGLGIDQMLTPPLAVRVLNEAGFNAAVVEREPQHILALLLPVVLLLKNGDACVLLGRQKRGGVLQYRLLMPGAEAGEAPVEVQASEAELKTEYAGCALIAAPRLHETAPGTTDPHDDDGVLPPGRHWLWGTMLRYLPYYRGAMLAALLTNVLMLFTGLFSSVVYDRVIPHQAYATLWSMGAGAVLAIVFDLMARQLRSHLIDLAGKKADLAMGTILYRKALSIRLESRPASSGSFTHELGKLEVVREFCTSATMSALSDLPFVLLFVGMIWLMAGELVVVMLFAIPILLIMTAGIQGVLRRAMRDNHRQMADLHGLMVESMDGMEAIRAAGAQGFFLRQYEQTQAAASAAAIRSKALTAWVSNFSMVAQQMVTVALLFWGVHLIHEGKLTAGGLMSAVMFAMRAIGPLNQVVGLASRYQGARAAMRSLDHLMSQPTEREPGKLYAPRPFIAGALALRNVSFSYPEIEGHATQPALKDVNLQIQPGERVAILGKIGSGKSTILRLLAGLYLPSEGLTEVDGLDLRQIDPADYRAHLGFVSQEPRLFRASLRDNILLGRVHADVDLLPEICRLTGLDRIAAAHPAGMDMPVGEGGGSLSGGQRQLVALSRCLITRPQVLLMDEPTSSMDAQTEAQFLQYLKGVMGSRTLVVVTHRPALLEVVDRIVVVDAGRVIIDGPKQQVLAVLSGQAKAAADASAAPRPNLSVVN
jgi:ATP-binding cassette subfamily C protein LapB